jgi:hypothetical protein
VRARIVLTLWSCVVASPLVGAASASAEWRTRWTIPCTTFLDVSTDRYALGCHGAYEGARFLPGPDDGVVPLADQSWIVSPDFEREGGGLAIEVPDGELGWSRRARSPGGLVRAIAIDPAELRVASIESAGRHAVLVERELSSLRTVRSRALPWIAPLEEVALRFVRGDVVVVCPRGIFSIDGRRPRWIARARDAVVALAADRAVLVERDTTAGWLRVREVDLETGASRRTASVPVSEEPSSSLAAAVAADGSRLAIARNGHLTVLRWDDGRLGSVHEADDVDRVAIAGAAVLAWSERRGHGSPTLSSIDEGPAKSMASTPRIDPRPLGSDFALDVDPGDRSALAVIAPGASLDGERIMHAIAEETAMASVSVWLVPARALPADARAIAAALGPRWTERAARRPDGAIEITGHGGGCDPPEAWARIERYGEWLVRIELEVFASGEPQHDARVARWREQLRSIVIRRRD